MCASVNVIVEKVLSNMMNLTIKDEMKVVFVCLRKLFNHQRVSNLCKSNMIRISTNISYFRLSSSARDKAFVDSHYIYMGVVQKVLVLSVVLDDLWYAKMTFGES